MLIHQSRNTLKTFYYNEKQDKCFFKSIIIGTSLLVLVFCMVCGNDVWKTLFPSNVICCRLRLC